MHIKSAVKVIQGTLGLTWDDAFPFIRGIHSFAARQERIDEIQILAEKIGQLSDEELAQALEVYRR